VGVAIGQSQAADLLGIRGREDLTDPSAAVVSDQVHLIDVQGVEKLFEHLRVRRDRNVLFRRDFGVAMGQQINGDAPPDIRQLRQLVTPQMTIQEHAVHK